MKTARFICLAQRTAYLKTDSARSEPGETPLSFFKRMHKKFPEPDWEWEIARDF